MRSKSRLTMCKARYGVSGRRRFRGTISTVCCWRSIRSMKLPPRWSGRNSCGRSLSVSSYSRKSSRMATGSGRLSSTSLFLSMVQKWKNCPWKTKQWSRRLYCCCGWKNKRILKNLKLRNFDDLILMVNHTVSRHNILSDKWNIWMNFRWK